MPVDDPSDPLHQAWPVVVATLSDQVSQQHRACLTLTTPVGLLGTTVLLRVPTTYAKDALERALRDPIVAALSARLGKQVNLAVTVEDLDHVAGAADHRSDHHADDRHSSDGATGRESDLTDGHQHGDQLGEERRDQHGDDQAQAVDTDPQPVGWRPVGAGVAAATQPQGNQEPRTRNQEPEHPLAPDGAAGGGTPPKTPAAAPRHPVHPAHADHPSGRADPADLPAPHALPRPTGDNSHPLAGTVCQLMKRLGVGLVNPGNAKLNALLNAGVGVGQFEDAAHKALAAGKSFSYALGIVEREEREARALGAQLQKPRVAAQPANRQEALEARNRAVGDAWLQKMQAQAQVQTPTQTQMQMQMQTQGAGHAR